MMQLERLAKLVATMGGSGKWGAGKGKLGTGAGTIGSAEACLLALIIPRYLLPWALLALIPLGIWAAGQYEKAKGQNDPGEVIVDEVAGQWVALLGHFTASAESAGYLLPSLILFRLCDIIKPWPVRKMEKLPGGWGIMADDLLAGLMANLCLWLLRWGFIGGGIYRLLRLI